MPPVFDRYDVVLIDLGTHVSISHRHLGQCGEYVRLGHAVSQPVDGLGGLSDLAANPAVQVTLHLFDAFPGIEHHGLVFLQLGNDVPLTIGQGLTPNVIFGYLLQIGLGDFDVIAKDLVVAYFQVFDAGAFPFLLLQTGDKTSSVAGGEFQLVELGGKPRPQDTSLAHVAGRLRRNGILNETNHFRYRHQLLAQPGQCWNIIPIQVS